MSPDEAGLIPRSVLFSNPVREMVTLSRDGTRLAFLAPVDEVMNVWVAPVDNIDRARPVTADTHRGIRFYLCSYDPDYILYVQDTDGDENWHVYAVDLNSLETRDLTPFDRVNAQIEGLSPGSPREVLVGLNDRQPQLHDIHRVNIRTGASSCVQINDIGAAGFVVDIDLQVRLAMVATSDGGMDVLKKTDSGQWDQCMTVGSEDDITTYPIGFDSTGAVLYMVDSRGRDTSALVEVDVATMNLRVLASDGRADVNDITFHPTSRRPQAVSFEYQRAEWRVLDETISKDIEDIRRNDGGDFSVVSRSIDDLRWILRYTSDTGPAKFYLYDRARSDFRFLFSSRPELESYQLAPMRSGVIRSRDELDLVVYYTLPVGYSDSDPLPTVLLVHGGPWGRDSWGCHPHHQLLANRGYAVVAVNFRGSTGFGKAFVNAGDREWGGKMHDDLIDTVEWAVAEGIADPDRIAVMGGSYGGYATLVGLTFTPEVFACGVDVVGPSNLITMLETIPAYWEPMAAMERMRIGDRTNEKGRAFLRERSPLTHVERISRPLLIAQGANDPRVKQAESDQIVDAMTASAIPVTYVIYPDEGHGFVRPENNLSFMAVAEAFLAKCLGGRFEPIGEDFAGSSIQVVTGADGVPGLESALSSHENRP